MSETIKSTIDGAERSTIEIQRIIAKCCGLSRDDWPPETSIYDLGIDSLGLAALIAHCDEHFSIELDDSAILKIMSSRTIGQIVDVLQSLSNQSNPKHS